MSYGVSKLTKNNSFGKIHHVGVYINTGLDIVGTVWKYAQRMLGSNQYKVDKPVELPTTVTGTIGKIMGFGSIMGAMQEGKLAKALAADGLVVAEGENGKVALASATTGEIIVSGPAASMKPVIQSVKGFSLKGTDNKNRIGEDISVES